MENPLVSICCITYNHAAFIKQCLEGFLMQECNFTFEVLIHDDASTDGTFDIIKEFECLYPEIIKPIYQKENQYSKGIKPTFKYNFPRAKGKYIAMCEGDDYWIDPLKLQKQVDFLDANEDFGMIHTNANILHVKNNIYQNGVNNSIPLNYLSGDIFDNLLKPFPYPMIIKTATVLFRSKFDFTKIIKFSSEKSWLINDLVLWLEISSKSKVGYLPEISAIYRIHNNSVSNSNDVLKNYTFLKSAFDIRLYFTKCKKASEGTKENILNEQFNFFVRFGRVYGLNEAKTISSDLYKKLRESLTLKQKIFYYSIFNNYLNTSINIYENFSVRFQGKIN